MFITWNLIELDETHLIGPEDLVREQGIEIGGLIGSSTDPNLFMGICSAEPIDVGQWNLTILSDEEAIDFIEENWSLSLEEKVDFLDSIGLIIPGTNPQDFG